ncbi:hypothetical protein WG66_001548 [Moniliophthora roreri]|nr:hypothetical protein WG66_001548 [Moniliophthora roreri]
MGRIHEENACQKLIPDTPVYLFVRTIPRLSNDEAIWRSWVESAKYFWSLDPSGREEMLESTRVSLGLPSFATNVQVSLYSWSLDAYKAIERLQLLNSFDPRTTDFARSLGYPLVQLMRELEDSASESDIIADILELYDNDASEGSESDEEIVVYPRSNRAFVV